MSLDEAVPLTLVWAAGESRGHSGLPGPHTPEAARLAEGGPVTSVVVMTDGDLTLELEWEQRVLLLLCARHHTQEAVVLTRAEVSACVTDFFGRHKACRGTEKSAIQLGDADRDVLSEWR
jgi:hypothetical protein